MNYNIFYSKSFEINVFEIEFYYRTKESDTRADKVLKSIMEVIDRIEQNPQEFPIAFKSNNLNVRKAVVHNTLVIYFEIINKHDIMIDDIFHGKINI